MFSEGLDDVDTAFWYPEMPLTSSNMRVMTLNVCLPPPFLRNRDLPKQVTGNPFQHCTKICEDRFSCQKSAKIGSFDYNVLTTSVGNCVRLPCIGVVYW